MVRTVLWSGEMVQHGTKISEEVPGKPLGEKVI